MEFDSPADFARRTRTSTRHVYRLLAEGRLPSIRLGRAIRIPVRLALEQLGLKPHSDQHPEPVAVVGGYGTMTKTALEQAVEDLASRIPQEILGTHRPHFQVRAAGKRHVIVSLGEPAAAHAQFNEKGIHRLREAWVNVSHDGCQHCYVTEAADALEYSIPRERVREFYLLTLNVTLDRDSYEDPHPDFVTLRGARKAGIIA